MKKYEVEGHIPSFLPEGKNWKLIWHDEFDGPELDRTKWDFRLNFWGKPFAAYTDRGIRFDGNSNIELHRVEKDGFYVSPQLQTGSNSFDIPKNDPEKPWSVKNFWPLGNLSEPKFLHRFGYYEIRCKFQKYPEEMWSAFWVQSPSIGTTYSNRWSGVENDIMECFKKGEATTGNIMGGYGAQLHEEGRVHYALEKTPYGFHTFAMHWTPDEYIFYCDGKEVSRAKETVSQVPQFILLTTEVYGYREENPKKVDENGFIDDAFIVDYIRVFDETE